MKKTDTTYVVEFRGGEYEVSRPALLSMKVQRALARGKEDPQAMYDAMDLICCGKSEEYFDRMPEEDGTVSEYGASTEAFSEFLAKAAEIAGADAKN